MKEIVMYTTSTCPHCKTAKAYLQEKGYHFIEKNVQLDKAAAEEMRHRKLMGVPAFVIGEETVVGFDPAKIEAVLDYTVEACPNCSRRVRLPKGKGKVRITCKHCQEAFEVVSKKM
ncbi:glutaredoxin family protein [Fusibacter sp. JL298sf-3]